MARAIGAAPVCALGAVAGGVLGQFPSSQLVVSGALTIAQAAQILSAHGAVVVDAVLDVRQADQTLSGRGRVGVYAPYSNYSVTAKRSQPLNIVAQKTEPAVYP